MSKTLAELLDGVIAEQRSGLGAPTTREELILLIDERIQLFFASHQAQRGNAQRPRKAQPSLLKTEESLPPPRWYPSTEAAQRIGICVNELWNLFRGLHLGEGHSRSVSGQRQISEAALEKIHSRAYELHMTNKISWRR